MVIFFKHKKKAVYVAAILIIILISLQLYLSEKNNNLSDKNVQTNEIGVNTIQDNTDEIFPIIYFESEIGSNEYDTHTFFIEKSNAIETEKYFRGFSTAYPYSIVNNDKFYNYREVYGQLLSYYKSELQTIYLFDSFLSLEQKKQYILM